VRPLGAPAQIQEEKKMKTGILKKKENHLKLHKETLRNLAEEELKAAAGGATAQAFYSRQNPVLSNCCL
jgi:hypothetical protein